MTNIDGTLRRARSAASGWNPGRAVEFANQLRSGPVATTDWDSGAGETWARVINNGRVVAFVSVAFPLVMAEASVTLPNPSDNLAAIVVETLDVSTLTASNHVLNEVFGPSDRLEALDLGGFSANDLWFVTV
jgi:hypothetical protein